MRRVKNNSNMEIFKIQRPINSDSSSILIYNQDCSMFGQIVMTQEIAKYMGTDYKIYVRGYLDKRGFLHIEERVKNQRW